MSGNTPWIPTSSLSVELRVTNFCRVEVLESTPQYVLSYLGVQRRKHQPTTPNPSLDKVSGKPTVP
jgi:hypothetical protein